MNKKQIGSVLIIVGILLGLFVYLSKIREDKNIEAIISLQGGSCYLPDGTCLHEDRDYTLYFIGGILSASLIILGGYLFFFDKTEKLIQKQASILNDEIKESKKSNEFSAFLSGFSSDEQNLIKAVKEQEGIKQSTLRFKLGVSKTGLSLLLKSLEERDIITKKVSGKTNEIYLRKKF